MVDNFEEALRGRREELVERQELARLTHKVEELYGIKHELPLLQDSVERIKKVHDGSDGQEGIATRLKILETKAERFDKKQLELEGEIKELQKLKWKVYGIMTVLTPVALTVLGIVVQRLLGD